jgi:alpha-1,2-glucosyltransferase
MAQEEEEVVEPQSMMTDVETTRDLEHEITTSLVFNWFIGIPVTFVSFVLITYKISQKYATSQFIDEVFHVPMTLQYLDGDFRTWDPKVTTPPGLYYIGWLWSRMLQITRISKFVDVRSLTTLRMVNTVGGALVLPVSLSWLFILNPIGFWPASLALFPVLSNFYYLYYTDVWSTVFVASSLSFALGLPYGDKRSVWISAFLGGVSVWLRQTNIIWNLFVLVLVIERRAMIHKNFTDSFLNNCIKWIIQFVEDFYDFALPFVLNFVLFFIFLVVNRGITLGDKENHGVGLHLVQIFYCFTFLVVFTWPIWLSYDIMVDYFQRYKEGPVFIILEMILIMIVIRFFTVVHPFLLADNRHYTFYIFKNIINRFKYSKYLIAPVYHFAFYVVTNLLSANAFYFDSVHELPFKVARDLPLKPTGISILAFLGCTTLTIAPSPLFEPRYYIIPFVLFRLLIATSYESFLPNGSLKGIILKRLGLEFVWNVVVNLLLIFIFCSYEFKWDNDESIQRIIW